MRGECFTSSQGWSSTPVVPQAGPSATSLCLMQLSAVHVSTRSLCHHCLNANGNSVQSWSRSKAVHGSAKCSNPVCHCLSPGLLIYSLRAVKKPSLAYFLSFFCSPFDLSASPCSSSPTFHLTQHKLII